MGLAIAGLAMTYAPAFADAPETNGLICQFASVVDPTAEAGTQTGQVSGGPVVLTEQSADPSLPGTVPEAGTLTCKVTVAAGLTSDHTVDGQKVQGHSDTGVFTAGPATINYIAPPGTNVFLCSEFTDDSDGVTYYWDDDNGVWSTSALVHCGLAVGSPGDPEDDPINLIPCPTFAQLPAPVAETLQAQWGDCAASGPQSVIAVAGITATAGVLVTPPLWNCSQGSGVVGAIGSVTCNPPGLNSLVNCKEVFSASIAVPDVPPAVRATINGTTNCTGGLTVSTSANSNGTPVIALASKLGHPATPMPVTCSWNVTGGGPTAWAVLCGWNLPL